VISNLTRVFLHRTWYAWSTRRGKRVRRDRASSNRTRSPSYALKYAQAPSVSRLSRNSLRWVDSRCETKVRF